MKNFLLQRLSSEPDKSISPVGGAGSAEDRDENKDGSESSGLDSSKNTGMPKRYHTYSAGSAGPAPGMYPPASSTYGAGIYTPGSIPYAPGARDKEQQTNRILELYDEYKTVFKSKNLGKVEKIVVDIMDIDRDSPFIHVIHGEMFLYRGYAEKAHHHLTKYMETAEAIDDYALLVIATWNDFMDYRDLALRQYTACLDTVFDPYTMTRTLFNLISLKKRLKFLDSSLTYFNRLLGTPEGYLLIPCIQLQIIHIHILKGNRDAAIEAIGRLGKRMACSFVRRFKAYLDYTGGNYEAILKYKDRQMVDPYVSYLIGRIGTAMSISGVDVPHHFDEAIRNANGSPYIYNSYGNYYFGIGRYSDAAVQYNNALAIDPCFQPALDNMRLLTKANDSIYIARGDAESVSPAEADPDVEDTGFLFVWSLSGYTQCKCEVPFPGPLNAMLPSGQ